jgi:hypothetical protein
MGGRSLPLNQARQADVPVVVTTARAERPSLPPNVREVLPKPFDLDRLLGALRR